MNGKPVKRGNYNTRNNYKLQIIKMILDGESNSDIVKKLGCNENYPTVVRGQLRRMNPEEREALISEMKRPEPEKNQEPIKKKSSGFRTPYNSGRPYISRY